MTETTTVVNFKRGDRVVYLGDNAHRGLVGRVRGIDTLTGTTLVDVDFDLPGRRRIRKLVMSENLKKWETVA